MHEIWVALTFWFAGEIWSVSLAILGQLWIAALEPFVKPCYLLTTFDLRKGRRRREDAGGQEQPGSSHWVLVLMGFGYPTQKWLIIADHFDTLIISFISQYVHIISTIETYWNSIRFVWEISSITPSRGVQNVIQFLNPSSVCWYSALGWETLRSTEIVWRSSRRALWWWQFGREWHCYVTALNPVKMGIDSLTTKTRAMLSRVQRTGWN